MIECGKRKEDIRISTKIRCILGGPQTASYSKLITCVNLFWLLFCLSFVSIPGVLELKAMIKCTKGAIK